MNTPIPMLTDLVIIIAASLPLLFLFRRLGLPPIASFVMTGILIGPSGLRLVQSIESVNVAAEIGVVLLLFTVGMEVSLSRLLQTSLRIYVLAAGQIVVTALAGFAAAQLLGLAPGAAVVVGLVLSVSSSAIVLKGLSDRGELESPLGRVVVTICLVQDFAVVPMLLIIGFLGAGTADWSATARDVMRVAALGGVLYLAARFVLPPVMRRLLAINTSEVVLLLTILILLGTAWLTAWAGLSLAIGAFAAGLILSETEYYPQIYAEVAPFRTLFSSLFFVSVGMLLDLGFVMAHPLPVLGVAVGVLVVKTLVVLGVSLPLGTGLRVGLQAGFYVAQIGELSFLLMAAAMSRGLMDEAEFQYLIAATSLTLAVTPLIMQFAPRIVWRAIGRGSGAESSAPPSARPKPAVLIVGYGINGHNVARVLREAGIYHEVLDTNPETVRRARAESMIIHYGDVTRPEVLRHIDAAGFDSIVVAISDPGGTRRAVQLLRAAQPRAHLIVRTRFVAEVEDLETLGADVVVPEEFETSLRIFSELLHHYRVPPHIIAMQVEAVRGHSYGLLRTQAGSSVIESLERLLLQRLVEVVPILPQGPAVGKRLDDLDLSAGGGCMVLNVLRDGLPLRPPFEELVLQPDDLVVLYGNHTDLARTVERMTAAKH